MSSSVDQIKSRIDILSLVESYIKLDKAGKSWKGKCPFHSEKTPSFFVSPERGSYYCFGCGASGDIFTFVEEFEGLDFKGALKLLSERAGVALDAYSKENKEEKNEKDKLYEVMAEATKFFEKNLTASKPAQEYLKSRGLDEKTITDFRIGYALLDWRKLCDYLKGKGFVDNEIQKAGLAKTPSAAHTSPLIRGREGGGRMYDRFRGRIMFPISDSSGRVIAFSGRIFPESVPTPVGVGRPTFQESVGPKYLNSPETLLFNKSSVLFGIDKAKDSIRKNNFSILVEGQMDLVLSHQAGFKNTIASSGTAMTDQTVSKENIINNLGLVCRLSKNIVLAYDADKAGLNASNRFAKIALSLGMDVKAAAMPEGMDPADIISKKGAEAWREAIRNSKHFIPFMLERILKELSPDQRKIGKAIRERLLPFLNGIESAIDRSHFIRFISDKSGVAESALLEDLRKVESELKYETEETKIALVNAEKKLRKDPIERRLLGIAFWQESVGGKIIDPKIIFAKLDKVREFYKNKKEDLIYEAEAFYINSENLKKDVDEMLFSIEEEYLNEELVVLMVKLKNIKDNPEGKPSASYGAGKEEVEILKKISEINKRKEEIKNSR